MRFLLGLGLLGHVAAQVSQPLLAADVTHANVSHVTNNKFIARAVVDEAEVPLYVEKGTRRARSPLRRSLRVPGARRLGRAIGWTVCATAD